MHRKQPTTVFAPEERIHLATNTVKHHDGWLYADSANIQAIIRGEGGVLLVSSSDVRPIVYLPEHKVGETVYGLQELVFFLILDSWCVGRRGCSVVQRQSQTC